MEFHPKKYYALALIAAVLALCVIMLGAYTRLSDAGLGCPDWPGCYGKMVLPQAQHALSQAQKTFPAIPIESGKAWKEMIHRYFAGTLGSLILILSVWGFIRKRNVSSQPVAVLALLLAIVVFQAMLGMWTVTLKLFPPVVMAHLLGGMTVVSLLWWLTLSSKPHLISTPPTVKSVRPWAVVALVVLAAQIFLGAWTSTNYAALACPNFPMCRGTLFPPMLWTQAFDFFHPIGPNYEGGHLTMAARVTIQMAHRYGALITTAYLLPLTLSLIFIKKFRFLRNVALMILLFLCMQVTLGVLNIELTLPMWTAVLHNGVAALLLLSVVTLLHKLFSTRRETGL